MAEQKPEPAVASENTSTSQGSSKGNIGRKHKVLIVVGAILLAIGLILNFYFQAKMDEDLTLSEDFEHEFTSIGQTTNVNRDYLFAYNPAYNGTGTSTALSNYTTEAETTITGVNSSSDYVEFSYVKEIIEQPTLLIDVNTGSSPGGVAELPPMGPGMPAIPFPFEPHHASNSTMYLDEKNWTYRPDVYEDNGLPARTGYARSVFTHHLEQESYPVYISTIQSTTTAEFVEAVKVKGIETYRYAYSYAFQIPFPIYTNETTNLTAFLSFTESTDEYHEPTTGALLKQSTTLTYRLMTVGQGPPDTVEIYSESNDFEISQDDADSFSGGLFWIHNSQAIALVLILLGIAADAIALVLLARTKR